MIVTREVVERLEHAEAAQVAADMTRRGDAVVERRHGGVLSALPGRGFGRAHGVTLTVLDEGDVHDLVAWFARHDLEALVQLSAFAPERTVEALAAVGATPLRARAMWVRDAGQPVERTAPADVEVVRVDERTLDEFLTTLLRGMRGGDGSVSDTDRRRARQELEDQSLAQWLARRDGEPVGAAVSMTIDGVAVLGPAGTPEEHRGRGVQRALLEERLVATAAWGAELATVTTHVDTTSGRNAERCGFRLAQHQWVLRVGPGAPA